MKIQATNSQPQSFKGFIKIQSLINKQQEFQDMIINTKNIGYILPRGTNGNIKAAVLALISANHACDLYGSCGVPLDPKSKHLNYDHFCKQILLAEKDGYSEFNNKGLFEEESYLLLP